MGGGQQGSDKSHTRPEKVIDAEGEPSNTREVEDPTLWVVVEDEDGDTYTVPVGENERVAVEQDEPTNSTQN